MPGHLQEGFGCVVTNRFDQLLDDESDPFEVLKAAENKKKDAAAAGTTKTAAQAAKQPKKESQKDRKNPLLDKKEEPQPPVSLKKEGIRRVGRRPEQQSAHPGPQGSQPQGAPVEGRPTDRRPDRRPPRERRFEKPAEEKPEGGEFSTEKFAGDRPVRGRGGGRGGRGGRGRGMGRSDGFDSRGKREFDRHSGSDKSSLKAEEKRGGSGSHNWGTVKDELSELDQSNATEETPEGEEHPPADSENKWVSGQLPSCGFHTCSPGRQDGVAFASKPHLLVSQQRNLSRATIINYCHTLHKVLVTLLRKWFQGERG
ncbi:plasminogen activator inhibitor 1 RNA-binding protein-like isoform X3 [Brienomyrus brachyistius]|uniref:plasminogen activator inhibitor 1 RNA-binding protein-like isoform X3 n=1 Tax=Brienomyrus brachyistius TaxID=42636 RepID=UPI0020B1F847|nr:plasminogen activator inhibitor 1 RNA-binding protein-like isoform X3 [Brienomyrus brachyistius]